MMSSTQKGTKPHESLRKYNLKCHNQAPFPTHQNGHSQKKKKTKNSNNVKCQQEYETS